MDIYINDLRIFAHTGGKSFDANKPLIVLIHGAGTNHTFWGLQTRYFSHHGYSVLAIDLPGHGRSEGTAIDSIEEIALWLWKVLDKVSFRNVVLAGHSMGSLIALEAASRRPHDTDALILVGVAERVAVHSDLLAAAKKNDAAAFDMITDRGFGQKPHLGGQQSPGLWMLGGGRALLAECSPGVLNCDLSACDAYIGAIKASKKITCPTLLLLGDKDRMTPPKMSVPLKENIKISETKVLSDVGHMIMIEKPNETIDVMDEFLRRSFS